MTTTEFNEKYADYLGEGHYGMAINDPEIIAYMDKEFEKYIEDHPDFEYLQIKLKFNDPRVYTNASIMSAVWEQEIRKILQND
jgi:hypothetical protein